MSLKPFTHRFFTTFLLITLVGSMYLPLFCRHWQAALPTHRHIVLGPLYPGWEHHAHEAALHGPFDFHHAAPALQTRSAGLTRGTVISLYRLPAWSDTILSILEQPALILEWLSIPTPAGLAWRITHEKPATLNFALPPPDQPPRDPSL